MPDPLRCLRGIALGLMGETRLMQGAVQHIYIGVSYRQASIEGEI